MNQDLPRRTTPRFASPAPAEPGANDHETGGPRAGDRSLWPDSWLVAAAREEPPDLEALNELGLRFGLHLWSRCLRLTRHREQASDLAQETWHRVLRRRASLRPEQNFRAYLTTVATNLWRDGYRASRRAGPMAEYRLLPLDAALRGEEHPGPRQGSVGDGNAGTLAEAVPDARETESRARLLWCEELEHVLARLSPLQREVLLARFVRGESCAMIGRRHGRTEQTISAWVRDALVQARLHLEADARKRGPESRAVKA